MMLRVAFCVALVAGAIASPITLTARTDDETRTETVVCPGNQDIKEYFTGVKLQDITWDLVKSKTELETVLKNTNHMIVVDIDYDKTTKKATIFKDYNVEDFMKNLVETVDANKKIVKFNIQSKKAFNALIVDHLQENNVKPRTVQRNMDAFPQWFSFKDDSKFKFIKEIGEIYKNHKAIIDCYTFSFDLSADNNCAAKTDVEISAIKKLVKDFTMKKNLVIDVTDVDKIKNLKNTFETLTLKMNENNAKCVSPKTWDADLERIKKDHENILLLDVNEPDYFKAHKSVCKNTKGFLKTFKNPDEKKWKQVTKFTELESTVEEDIVKVDVSTSDLSTMFLGKTFDDFIAKFVEKQDGKGLQLNLKNKDAVDAYWKITTTSGVINKDIPFSIKVNREDFDYDSNKWMDCYTPIFTSNTTTDMYTQRDIDTLEEEATKVQSDEKLFSLEMLKISKSKDVNFEKLTKLEKQGLVIVNLETKSVDDVDALRDIIRKNVAKTFIDASDDQHQKLSAPVLITKLIPDIDKDKSALNFVTVDRVEDIDNLAKVMVTPKSKGNIKKFLDKISEKNDNAIKFKLTEESELKLLKYRNIPIWLQITDTTEKFISHEHQIVLALDDFQGIEEFKNARNSIDDNRPVILSVPAKDYSKDSKKIDQIKKAKDSLLIVKTDDFNSKALRDAVKDIKTCYVDVPNKVIFEECPTNQKISDFSEMKISEFVKSEADVEKYLGENTLIRAQITRKDGKLYINKDTFTLDKFFEVFEHKADIKKKGIIFTIADTTTFDAATLVDEMKTLNYPIWFDINVYKAGSDEKKVEINYEKNNDIIDCRTLLLGLEITGNFKSYSAKDIEHLQSIENKNENIYSIRADYLESDWTEVQKLKPILSVLPEAKTIPNSKAYRDFTKEHKEVIASDFPGKEHLLEECPAKNDFLAYFTSIEGLQDDLSKLILTKPITKLDDITEETLKDHIVNVQVSLNTEDEVIIADDVKLITLLEAMKSEESILFGAKITFDSDKTFKKAVENRDIYKLLRNINRPIWIEALVIGEEEKIVKLDYTKNNDLLDCRTLSLGWADGDDQYSKENIAAMKALELGNNQKMYSVEVAHVEHVWEEVNTLLKDNKNLVILKSQNSISYSSELETILTDNKERVLYDVPEEIKKALFNGSGNISSNLLFALVLSFIVFKLN